MAGSIINAKVDRARVIGPGQRDGWSSQEGQELQRSCSLKLCHSAAQALVLVLPFRQSPMLSIGISILFFLSRALVRIVWWSPDGGSGLRLCYFLAGSWGDLRELGQNYSSNRRVRVDYVRLQDLLKVTPDPIGRCELPGQCSIWVYTVTLVFPPARSPR